MDLAEFKNIGIELTKKGGIGEIKEDLSHLLDRNSVNEWMPFWLKNLVENYQVIPKERPQTIGQLKNIHWGQEAAILFSGPSFDDSLPYLDKFKGIIFSGASTFNPCMANGIIPDWVSVIDSDEYVPKQFEGFDLKNIKALLSTIIHPEVIKIFNPDLIWWFNNWDYRQWFTHRGIQTIFPKVDSLLSSSCVPGAMIRLAYFMGIRKMYLLGADFGYPGGRERCSIYHKEGDKWIKGSHDPFCEDKSPREIFNGIETTLKLRVSHDAIKGIINDLKGLEVIDCSHGILNEYPKKEFKEVVNG